MLSWLAWAFSASCSQAGSPLCIGLRDNASRGVLAVVATEPADMPFLGMPVAVAVDVYTHFDAVDVLASAAGFQLHGTTSS
jgi:hypothetical protein